MQCWGNKRDTIITESSHCSERDQQQQKPEEDKRASGRRQLFTKTNSRRAQIIRTHSPSTCHHSTRQLKSGVWSSVHLMAVSSELDRVTFSWVRLLTCFLGGYSVSVCVSLSLCVPYPLGCSSACRLLRYSLSLCLCLCLCP